MKRIFNAAFPWLFVLVAFCLVLAICVHANADDPVPPKPTPVPVPSPPVIHFPVFPVKPEPKPPTPAPGPVQTPHVLMPGELYVVQSDAKFKMTLYPENMVNVMMFTGPTNVNGIFAGGDGTREMRDLTGYVALLQAPDGVSGRLVLTAGVNGPDEPAMVLQLIDIGVAPQPPPSPVPNPPQPLPVPPTPPAPLTAAKLWIVNIYPSGKMAPALQSVLLNQTYLNSVEGKGHKYTNMSTQNVVARNFDATLSAAKQALPATVIMDMATRQVMATVPTPTTTAAMDSLIAKYTTPQ